MLCTKQQAVSETMTASNVAEALVAQGGFEQSSDWVIKECFEHKDTAIDRTLEVQMQLSLPSYFHVSSFSSQNFNCTE